jgi:hypothetical protein
MTAVGTTSEIRKQSRLARWGWGILLTVSALLVLNGILWFFIGPQREGAEIEGFRQAFPALAQQMATNARQVAIWFMSFGLLALLVALEGFRHGSRWAWNATWVVVAVLTAIGILYRGGFGVILLGLVPIVLVGQLLARRGLTA